LATLIVSSSDVLEARRVGNFAGRAVPPWETYLAKRLKARGRPRLFNVLAAAALDNSTAMNGEMAAAEPLPSLSSAVDGPFAQTADPAPVEDPPSQLLDSPPSASASVVKSFPVMSPTVESTLSARPESSVALKLGDPRLACSPDRHNVGALPDATALDEVDSLLLGCFMAIHVQMLNKLHPGRLKETRELFLQDFVRHLTSLRQGPTD
jgi:hypothetical protein